MRPIISNVVNTATKPLMMTPPAMAQPRSPWHSPVPYLFGGLAVMLGLIAFALLILSCSYWRNITGWNNNGGGEDDVEKEGESNKQVKVNNYEEKIVVIMAGEVKPTFLATPVVFTKASSYGDKNGKLEEEEKAESDEKVVKEEMGEEDHQPLPIITENSENHHERQQTSQDQSC